MDGNYGGFPHVDGHGILPSFEYWSEYLLEDVPVLESSVISPPVIVAAGGSPERRTFTVEDISMEEQNSSQSRQAMNKYNSAFLQLTIVTGASTPCTNCECFSLIYRFIFFNIG